MLQGKEDINAVPENANRLAAEFPDRVTLVEIPDSGDAMLPAQPERIATAILNYLRTTASGRSLTDGTKRQKTDPVADVSHATVRST